MTRVAFKLAYIGTEFEGFQIQPGKRTIEFEIFKALRDLNIIQDPRSANYQSAGRTDKGVHALNQVIAFNTSKIELAQPRVINSRLPDSIWTWARAFVPEDFDPRIQAIKREYRYILYNEGFALEKMKRAAELFIGEHDFANFSTIERGRSTIRIIHKIKLKKQGDFLFIDIEANSFTWNMVRKIVTALKMIGRGEREEKWIELMLSPSIHREGLQSAPAFGAILKKVRYRNIKFEIDTYAKRKASEKLRQWFIRHYTTAKVLKEIASGMK
ncbi:MAG: tRNA pseudouridine(38-40) synthase TruA [Methanocellales archaeon]